MQTSFLPEQGSGDQRNISSESFSHEGVAPENARLELELRYKGILEETPKFNRKLVSFQASKDEILHSWLKYREGFSPQLVDGLLDEFGVQMGERILEPFAGSSTTLLVAMMRGIDATGIEILPHCHLAWQAKSRIAEYSVDELASIAQEVDQSTYPSTPNRFPHLPITADAFSEETEKELMSLTHWIEGSSISDDARCLCRLVATSILESVSYTRKDGQYLRWDMRSKKVQNRNRRRMDQGKKRSRGIDKGALPNVREVFVAALHEIIRDIRILKEQTYPHSQQELLDGSALFILPTMDEGQFAGVITSPPYANRYDYTRTYALELAYLGVKEKISNLRQSLLSCTVENRSKMKALSDYYLEIGRRESFDEVVSVIKDNAVLNEVNHALQLRKERGEINNDGVLTMVDNYFSELTFVFAELYRVCRPGAHVAFVNDNVRYAGEIIPVDLLTTNLAEQFGFEPLKVYVFPQRKGNSSQQMAKYGRVPLRKSITIWRKP